jgi:site-specific DNA-cytosine methylase
MDDTRPRALAGNVFGGPFIKGVLDAGFNVVAQLEHNDYGVRTSKLNFPWLDIRVGKESWHLEDFTNIDFMFTNPPCAPWSTASGNKGCDWSEDPRLDCISSLVQAGLVVKPKVWMWESVVTCFTKGRSFLDARAAEWMEAGYHVSILLQNNLYLGAPQNRKRMFFIAHRSPLLFPPFTKPRTVDEVLAEVEILESEKIYAKRIFDEAVWEKSLDHNGKFLASYHALPEDYQTGTKPGFLSQRLRGDEPCPVLFPINAWHPHEPRKLVYGEVLALCGLPQTWQLETYTESAVSGLLSRCVLAPVGKWMAEAVKAGLDWDELDPPPKFNIYDVRKQ